MDVMTAIKGRRSVRRFEDKPIDKETLLKLLEAAVWAPSGGVGKTWRFVVVTDEAMMKKIKMVSPGLLGGPPVVIVIAQDMALAKHKGGKMGPESLTKMDSGHGRPEYHARRLRDEPGDLRHRFVPPRGGGQAPQSTGAYPTPPHGQRRPPGPRPASPAEAI